MRRAWSAIPIFGALVFLCASFSYSYADHRSWENDRVTVSDVFGHIEEGYLYQIDVSACKSEMFRAARRGSAQSGHKPDGTIDHSKKSCLYEILDKFSFVETVKAREEESIMMGNESYGGVGMEIALELPDRKVRVQGVFPNSGAEEAGIKNGDFILRVRNEGEREFTKAEDVHVVVGKLRGPTGTRVVVEIERGGAVFSLTITRKEVLLRTVFPKKIGSDIGYVRISVFGLNTADDFEDAVSKMDPSKLKGLIIDLRSNPGGNLVAATEMLYYFSKNPDDIMFVYRSRFAGEAQDILYTIKEPLGAQCEQELLSGMYCPVFISPRTNAIKVPGRFADLRVVVLVNKSSASASEIFSGTLKDWGSPSGIFTVVGTTSFGKGVGQMIVPLESLLLSGEKFYLHYTTFEFLVGNRRVPVQGVGVVPNIVVEDTMTEREQRRSSSETIDVAHDSQLRRAIAVLR